MNCFSCSNQYDQNVHLPRLLTQCGHSICSNCLVKQFQGNKLICPECQTQNYATSVQSFPKNLAILNIQQQQNIQIMVEDNMNYIESDNMNCPKHNRPIEAFCEVEHASLCVTCILEDGYRNKEICNVQNAVQRQRDILYQGMKVCAKMESEIVNQQQNLVQAQNMLSQNADVILNQQIKQFCIYLYIRVNGIQNKQLIQFIRNFYILYTKIIVLLQYYANFNKLIKQQIAQNKITEIYDQVRKVLQERENFLKCKVNEQFNKEHQQIQILNDSLMIQQQEIEEFYKQNEIYQKQSGLYILQNSFQIQQTLLAATKKLNQQQIQVNYPDVIKDSEISLIFKTLTTKQKPQVSIPQSQQNTLTTLIKQNQQNDKKITTVSSTNNLSKEIQRPKTMQSYAQQRDNLKQMNSQQQQPKRSSSKNWKKSENEAPKSSIQKTELIKIQSEMSKIQNNIKQQVLNQRSMNQQSPPRENVEKLKKHMALQQHIFDDISQVQDNNFLNFSTIVSSSNKILDNNDESIQQEMNKFLKSDTSNFNQTFMEKVYIFGGFQDINRDDNTIECYDLIEDSWEEIALLPFNRVKFGLVTIENGNLLLIGGKQDGQRVNTFLEFDLQEKKFRECNMKLSKAKSGFGCLSQNESIYIIGGNDGENILDSFEKYNTKSGVCEKLCALNTNRDELAVTLGADGRIYAIGGFGGSNNSCLNSVERYDFKTNKWEKVACLNTPRRALGVVSLKTGIYAVGGFDGNNYLKSVEKYNYNKNIWEYVTDMNQSRCTLAAISDGKQILAIGGFDDGPLNSVERYSIHNNQWDVIQPMKSKRFMHAAVGI